MSTVFKRPQGFAPGVHQVHQPKQYGENEDCSACSDGFDQALKRIAAKHQLFGQGPCDQHEQHNGIRKQIVEMSALGWKVRRPKSATATTAISHQNKSQTASRCKLAEPTRRERQALRGNSVLFYMVADGEKPSESGEKQSGEAGAKHHLEAQDMVARERSCKVCCR